MPWVRFDDQFPINRKVNTLPDATFRLHIDAIFWCVRNRLEAVLPIADLPLVARMNRPQRHVNLLIERGLWVALEGGWMVLPSDELFDWWSVERRDYRQRIRGEVREAVFRRDGNRCVNCNATENLTLDHIYPWSLGGRDTETNLRVLCRSCNSSKGARLS